MSVDTTSGGTATRSGLIWIYDAVDGAGTLTLDAGSGGNILVNHLTGATGSTTPLVGITVANGSDVSFFKDVTAGTVRIVDATVAVAFAGVLDITVGFVAEAQPYSVTMLGGDSGSSRIAGVTTFHNTGLLAFGNQGPPDVFTFVGGLVATAPSEVRLTASILADTGSIVLGDGDSDVTVVGATIGGAATAITLADVVLNANGGLIIGTGLANTVQVGSVAGTVTGFADALTINTAGTVTISGSVGSGLDQLTITNSGGTTFEDGVAAGTVTLTDTVGTITFQGDLTATTLITAANGYSVAFQGAATTVAGNTLFLNTGTVSFGNEASDLATFSGGLATPGPGDVSVVGTAATAGPLSLGAATTLGIAVSGVQPGVGYGQFTVAAGGTVALGLASLDVTASVFLPLGTVLTIVDNRGSAQVAGTFAGLPEGALISTPVALLRVSYVGGDGNDVTLEAVPAQNTVNVKDDVLVLRLAVTGTTISDLSTRYLPAATTLVVTVASNRPLVGSGTGLTVDSAAGTVTVDLAQLPGFRGIRVVGTGAADSITLGPRGVNLASITRGAASQSLVIDTGSGADVVTIRSPVLTRGSAGFVGVRSAAVNLGTAVSTPGGVQSYEGGVSLVGNTSLKGRDIAFNGTLDGARQLAINATGSVVFGGDVGATTPLKGMTISQAGFVALTGGLRLDGRGVGAAVNGLVIGRGVANVVFGVVNPTLAVRSISGFAGSGILFDGGSAGSVVRQVSISGNAGGITMRPGTYTGTQLVGNTITANRASGIVMQSARGVTVAANTVVGNLGWGLLATGDCRNTVLQGNAVAGNRQGNVNTRFARGISIAPA